jgi:hypothetical protein
MPKKLARPCWTSPDKPMACMRMNGLAAAYRVQASVDIEIVLNSVRGRNLLRIQATC